jgi:hypothetical protein
LCASSAQAAKVQKKTAKILLKAREDESAAPEAAAEEEWRVSFLPPISKSHKTANVGK